MCFEKGLFTCIKCKKRKTFECDEYRMSLLLNNNNKSIR